MSRVLWPGERIGEHTSLPQHALIRSKRKVVFMLICGKFKVYELDHLDIIFA